MEATLADRTTKTILSDRILDSALSGAAGAVAFSGDALTNAVLGLPAEVLGKALQDRLQAMSGALHAGPPSKGKATSRKAPLVRKVSLPEIRPFTGNEKGLDRAKLQAHARAARRDMVQNGELLDTTAMTEALGMSRQALNKAVTTGRMFSVEVDATPYYPAFYASDEVERRVLENVTRKLADLKGPVKLDFFTAPNNALGGISPLEALKQGLVSETLELAEAYGLQ